MTRFKFGKLQKKCMDEIAKGKKIAAVARANGVHRCSIHRWLQREEVQEYLAFRKEVECAKALQQLTLQLDDPNPWASLRAAKKIMEMEHDILHGFARHKS